MLTTTLRRSPVTSGVVTGLLALSLAAIPGPAAPAQAESKPATSRVLPGTRLIARRVLFVLPVRGYQLTGRFGDRSSLWQSIHTGLDFAAPSGTPILAVSAGVVVLTGYDGSYGNQTVVRLADGTELWFCHQSAITVRAGSHVEPGELIGYVGSTGNVTGPHLHLEVHPGGGEPVDPYAWLTRHGLRP